MLIILFDGGAITSLSLTKRFYQSFLFLTGEISSSGNEKCRMNGNMSGPCVFFFKWDPKSYRLIRLARKNVRARDRDDGSILTLTHWSRSPLVSLVWAILSLTSGGSM